MHDTARLLGAAALAVSSPLLSPAGDAAAAGDGCPDVEVVFARGTAEPPGLGAIGQQFVDALRWRVGARSFNVYPVNYPARPEFATTVDGVVDASNHIRDTAANCPLTEMVLGGYSRGAALVGYVTAPENPPDYPPLAGTVPLPPDVAGHVVAVVMLGKPSTDFLNSIGAPPLVTGADYAVKTLDLCAPGDPICSTGSDGAAHAAYATNGMTLQAADFAAVHLAEPATGPGASA